MADKNVHPPEPRLVFVAHLRRAQVLSWLDSGKGASPRERDILHMKSGRALEGMSQSPAMRAAAPKTAVFSCGMLVMMLLFASDVYGQATTRPAGRPMVMGPAHATEKDGPAYRIDRFELKYKQDRQGVPSINELMQLEVELGRTDDGYVVPRLGLPTVRFRLANAPRQLFDRYYETALAAINLQITRYLNSKG